jgi:hypothetical protein
MRARVFVVWNLVLTSVCLADCLLSPPVCTAVLLIEELQIKYYNCGFKEFEKKKAAEDKKKYGTSQMLALTETPWRLRGS